MYNNYLKQNNNMPGGMGIPQMPQQIPQLPQQMARPQMQGAYPMQQTMPQMASMPMGQLPQMQAMQQMPAQPVQMPTQPQGAEINPAELRRQAEEFSRKYPEFNLEKEIENPQFCKYILENKLTIEEAYMLAHREELMGKAKAEALEDFRAKRDRIPENGTGRTAGAVVKMNPKDMRDEDIAAIIERVRKGEKITF